MSSRILTLRIPGGISLKRAAEILNAYLCNKPVKENPDSDQGPFSLAEDGSNWQLDTSNDYRLHRKSYGINNEATLSCRYQYQEHKIKEILDRFATEFPAEPR